MCGSLITLSSSIFQEYAAYEQMQANYFDYCENKKKKIRDKLLELVDETSVCWFQRSRILGLCGRLEDSIDCLSLAVESLVSQLIFLD